MSPKANVEPRDLMTNQSPAAFDQFPTSRKELPYARTLAGSLVVAASLLGCLDIGVVAPRIGESTTYLLVPEGDTKPDRNPNAGPISATTSRHPTGGKRGRF